MKIIVNADDLGLGKRENDATFELMETGKITSATLLANGAALDHAISRLKEFPQCSFGVHLNLTEFVPCSSLEGLSPILSGDGTFRGNIREIGIDGPLREAIFLEWSAQIGRLKDLGVSISHIDGHHHVHTLPSLFPVLKRIQRKFEIRKVRPTKNLPSKSYPMSKLHLMNKAVWNMAVRLYHPTRMTRAFTSFAEFIELVHDGQLKSCASVELMVHPGSPLFEGETELLKQDWIGSLGFPVELISYNDL